MAAFTPSTGLVGVETRIFSIVSDDDNREGIAPQPQMLAQQQQQQQQLRSAVTGATTTSFGAGSWKAFGVTRLIPCSPGRPRLGVGVEHAHAHGTTTPAAAVTAAAASAAPSVSHLPRAAPPGNRHAGGHAYAAAHGGARRTLPPAGAAAVAAATHAGSPAASVLLRHSHGGTTRILYADGPVETITTPPPAGTSIASALRSPMSGAAHRRPWGSGDRRGRVPTSPHRGGAAAAPPQAPSRLPSSPPPEAAAATAAAPWLLESFNAVAQVHQWPLPPLPEPAAIAPQWSGLVSSSSSRPSTPGEEASAATAATESRPTRIFPAEVANTVAPQQQQQQQQQQPGAMDLAVPLPPPKRRKPPRPLSAADSGSGSGSGASVSGRDEEDGDYASGCTAAFLTSVSAEPPVMLTAASASRHGRGGGGGGVHRVVAAAPSRDHGASSYNSSNEASEAADPISTVIAAMQRTVRAELAAEQRAGAQTFASRYARDITASPSIFSLRFPFRPLSELCGFASSGASSPSMTTPSSASSPTNGKTPDVLLPDAQSTTPCGFSVPELLHDRLLPRETPALQHKLSELYTIRGLIDARDSTACRFVVAFVWFVLLRCRKAHREQSLVDGFRRLTRAFADVFPHIPLDEAPPPLDVLEQLLVELITCARYSSHVAAAADATANAAAAAAATAAAAAAAATSVSMFAGTLDITSGAVSLQSTSRSREAAAAAVSAASGAAVAVAPVTVPLRFRLSDHGGATFFPLLLSPAWSKLINASGGGGGDDGSSGDGGGHADVPGRYTLSTPQLPVHQSPPAHQMHRAAGERGVLPSDEGLAILCRVYHDLWLHHSEYVQLCLYEDLLYRQLARLFGTFVMHLHQAAMNTTTMATATATTATHTAAASASPLGTPPAATWSTATGAGEGGNRASTSTTTANTATIAATTTAVAAAAAVTPVVKDSILDSLLLLIAHATYYNCVFCFPNDVYAGLFDDDFRADVVRWLSFCCHGVVLTHVQVRRWPTPAKGDYADAQLKRKAAVEHELAVLGLLSAKDQQQQQQQHQYPVSPRVAVAAGGQTVSSFAGAATAGQVATSLVLTSDDGAYDVGDVAANSECRLAYQLDRYGRSAALHVAELERCMARLQRRHMAAIGSLHGGHGSQRRLMRGSATALRTPSGSRRGSTASVTAVPPLHRTASNLSETSASPSAVSPAARASRANKQQRSEVSNPLAVSRTASVAVDTSTATRDSASTAAPSSILPMLDPRGVGGGGGGSRSGSRQSGLTLLSGGAARRQRGRRTPVAAAAPHRDHNEELRAQFRTSAAAPVDKSLVTLAAELARAGQRNPANTTTAGGGGVGGGGAASRLALHHTGRRQSASPPPSARRQSRGGGGGEAAAPGETASTGKGDGERPTTEGSRRRQRQTSSAGSLLSSYPLCVSPTSICEYWLAMLLRAPCWWTTRTALATAAAVAGAEAATSPAALQQQSAQLVLWSSNPTGADGRAIPAQDLCRLGLEPWRALFTGVVVVPPISDEAQQAAQRIRVYGRTLPRQQARLYRMAELQLLHHRQYCLPPALTAITTVVSPVSGAASPLAFVLPAMAAFEQDASAGCLATPRVVSTPRVAPPPSAATDALGLSAATLPLVPPITPKDAAALAASTTTAMLAVAAASATPSAAHVRRRGIGETYVGSTSPFFLHFSSSFASTSSRGSPGSASGRAGDRERGRWPAPQRRGHGHGATGDEGHSSAGADTGDADAGLDGAATSPRSRGGAAALPALATASHRAPADAQGLSPLSPSAATTTTTTTTGAALAGLASTPSTFSSEVDSSRQHHHQHHTQHSPRRRRRSLDGDSRSGGGETRSAVLHQSNTFAITAIRREEAKLRPHRLGPVKAEALRRRAQLLTDMDTIGKRDRVSRQVYVVQHLQLSNAMAYTQSEAMMRRYRAHGRLALERLACSSSGGGGETGEAAPGHHRHHHHRHTAAAAAAAVSRAVAEKAKDFNL
ncbi:hypothetical protein NESM_000253200 [Novymonas esmeraldas]|uniref:Uncharacterized protein n=1 Tax=Novymonas esmeraldas TaxID=1808958 RepID=A0AAW0F857_9TRYP